jgi:hypothetical protein
MSRDRRGRGEKGKRSGDREKIKGGRERRQEDWDGMGGEERRKVRPAG